MEETAKQYLRNQQYYCSLIDSALEGIPAAYIADDGTTEVFNWAMQQDYYEYDPEEDLLYRRAETSEIEEARRG